MAHRIRNAFLRISLKTLMWVAIALLVLPAALYIPAVQRAVVNFALDKVEASSGMHIDVRHFRLRWPLRIDVGGVTVVTAPGDTMARLNSMNVEVEPLPLLALKVCARADADGVAYTMGSPDSLMYLRATADTFALMPSTFDIRNNHLDISSARLADADVTLAINGTDTTATQTDSASSTPMVIAAQSLRLERVRYAMTMMPVIDSLGAYVPSATLTDGLVDMASHRIDAAELRVDSISASYITPSEEYAASHTADEQSSADTADSTKWTVTARRLRLSGQSATYATAGAVPQPGLDLNYIQATAIDIQVDSFFNRGAEISVPLRRLSLAERSGLKLDASGTFTMDTVRMQAREFHIATIFSTLDLDAIMGLGPLSAPAPVLLNAKARIGIPDVETAYPSLRPVLAHVPRYNDLVIEAKAHGTTADISLDRLYAALPHYVELQASGQLADVMQPDRLDGTVAISGRIHNVDFLKPTLAELQRQGAAMQFDIPPLTLDGKADFVKGAVAGAIKATTAQGRLALDGRWNGRAAAYGADLSMDAFPISAFLPTLGIGTVSATATVDGRGFDPTDRATAINADIDLKSISYHSDTYTDLKAWARLDSCVIDAGIVSLNPGADLDMGLSGTVAADATYHVSLEGDVRHLDLQRLRFTPSRCEGAFSIAAEATMTPARSLYDAQISITGIDWMADSMHIATPEVTARFNTTDSSTMAAIDNQSLHIRLDAPSGLDSLMAAIARTSATADTAIALRRIDFARLQRVMPRFTLDAAADTPSLLDGLLRESGMSYRQWAVHAENDTAIIAAATMLGLSTASVKTDSLTLALVQADSLMHIAAAMNNRPGTFDDFAHVELDGYIGGNALAADLTQRNIEHQTGYRMGLQANINDSTLHLHFTPEHPLIGYREWTLNPDNFISYDIPHRHLDADLALMSGDSFLKIHTSAHDHSAGFSSEAETVNINASRIQLADWLKVSPFAPPVKGLAGADINVTWDPAERAITGTGTVSLDSLQYGKEQVGSFLLGVDLGTNTHGVVHASASLMVDSMKVITAVGALNDSTKPSPMTLDFSMIHFPLKIANPFLPKGTARLSGMLNGKMDITGSLADPRFDGYISFDSAAARIDMTGTTLTFDTIRIPVDSNVVAFSGYTIKGANEKPLVIDGTVDMHRLASPLIDLAFKADGMQIIGSGKRRGQDVFGKAYIDLDASVKGSLKFMRVNATLDLLAGSNITYVMNPTQQKMNAMESTAEGVVRFVQFSDTTSVMEADTIADTGMALMLDTRLIISDGTTINVDLQSGSNDMVQLKGAGDLTLAMSPFSDMRLTGRYTIESGFARYTPPLMSEKEFQFKSGSYVAFNGDMLNPILNIHASDEIRANVTEEGQNSRLVNFIVGLNVTNSLQNMDVAFDLSTNDDLGIQNELQSMSPEQRANQAMNMLLYNVYTGPNTKASATLGSNRLFSFLTSQLNSWAAKNIKGVDISFGVDQYDRTFDGNTSTTTSYSYKVSKTLFNDRFKIIVGGNYNSDADADENFEQNIINDVSLEYMLNRAGTMYIRLFRHVGYESILEGEVTQTGLGFVYRRKLRSLRELIPWRRHHAGEALKPEAAEPQAAEPSQPQ